MSCSIRDRVDNGVDIAMSKFIGGATSFDRVDNTVVMKASEKFTKNQLFLIAQKNARKPRGRRIRRSASPQRKQPSPCHLLGHKLKPMEACQLREKHWKFEQCWMRCPTLFSAQIE